MGLLSQTSSEFQQYASENDFLSRPVREAMAKADSLDLTEKLLTAQEAVYAIIGGYALLKGIGKFAVKRYAKQSLKNNLKSSVDEVAGSEFVDDFARISSTSDDFVKFTQNRADDLVINLKEVYGGNVTVMKDGVPIFRVHQPGSHGNLSSTVTKFRQGRINPNTGRAQNIADKKVSNFDQGIFDTLNKAVRGENGFSIVTKRGR